MKNISLDQIFRESLSHYETLYGRGFQARISLLSGIKSTQINDFLKCRRGLPEEKRRALLHSVNEMFEDVSFSYDDFLSLGQHLLNGGTEKEWKTSRNEKTNSSQTTANISELSEAHELPPARKIPVISWVQAGDFCGIEEIDISGVEQWVNCYRKVSDNSFALVVRGNSMEPEFREGENIVIDPAVPAETGKFVVAKIEDCGTDGEATFKQFVKDGGQVFLRPLNNAYPIIDMTGKKFTVCGCVVQKSKDY